MPTLKKVNQVFAGVKYIGNFLNRPLEIGDIVQWDDGQHLPMGNMSDLIPGFKWDGKLQTSSASFFKLTQESNVQVTLGGQGNADLGKAEVELSFGAKNSAFVALNDVTSTSIKLAMVEADMKALWAERKWDRPGKRNKFYVVSEVKRSESGTMIFSQERNNKVVLKAENNTPVTSLQALGSGKFEYVSNSKATLEVISPNPSSCLYRCVYLKSNGLFELVDR